MKHSERLERYARPVALAIVIIFGALYGGFLYGKSTASDVAYKSGYTAGQNAVDTTNLVPKALLNWREGEVSDLTAQNKKLVDDYNNLLNQSNDALKQATRPVYYTPPANTSIRCTTNTLSTTTYTNCY